MTEVIAGVEVPETAASVEASRLVRGTASALTFHHSRRVFLFGAMQARERGPDADPELLYLAALFHDTGLARPFLDVEQRFELDGADHARAFLLDLGWPAVAALARGVLVDVVGLGLDGMDASQVDDVSHRPDTTYGTNADVLEHVVPGFRRTSTADRGTHSPWST